MPAIDFPAAPAVNDEYSFEGRTWRWNGTGWEVKEYPAALLAGTAANPSLYFTGDTNTGLYSPGADAVAISTDGSERARINNAGQLLVGTNTARQVGLITPDNQLESTGWGLSIVRNNNDFQSGGITLGKTRGTTIGSNTIVQSGDRLGFIGFCGADGVDLDSYGGQIVCEVDGTPGANDMPGRLVFSTTADGSASPAEALRITSDKYLRMAASTGGIQFNGDTAAVNALDDYEEGTFTPTVIGLTTAGTATYSTRIGVYTKVGRVVQFEIYLTWTSGTGTGTFAITDLPFTSSATPATNTAVVIAGQVDIALTAGNYINGYIGSSTNRVALNQSPTGGGARTAVSYDAAGEIMISGAYRV